MRLKFKRLPEANPADLIEPMDPPQVRRLMPLAREAECKGFVEGKERLWQEHSYGPWAFFVGGQSAGWGGLQPEGGDADLGLMLHPNFWGTGKAIYDEILRRAFGEMGLGSVTVLFPPLRTRLRGLLRLGFVGDEGLEVAGERFIRYRLYAPSP